MALFAHKFLIGSREYTIKLPNYYDDGGNSNIGSAMGITKLAAGVDVDPEADTVEIGEGLKSGKLLRMRISYSGANTNNKTKSSLIICPVDKAKTALSTILSKTYRGNNIVSAGIPRRRRLG